MLKFWIANSLYSLDTVPFYSTVSRGTFELEYINLSFKKLLLWECKCYYYSTVLSLVHKIIVSHNDLL